jgi:mono/diheme cytochrome c family protein
VIRPRFNLVFLGLLAAWSLPGAEPVDFNRQIRPMLSANCFACHGPDEHARKAKLRLDNFAGAREVVQSGELVKRITTADEDDVMPPPKSGNRLSAREIDLLKQWVREGAKYSVHWAFTEVKRPEPPKIKQRGWAKNEIDRFVLARLEQAKLKPEGEAERRTLIRRLSLDLMGLPPTRQEVTEFLADRSPKAYENLVDRLLASKRYGEHWARMWLDLARYADTKGYEKDQARTMWRYRDWVIDAFNADMRYDEFTRLQLAGDLLPGATEEQILATAFHRSTMTNDEGGTDDEEFRTIAVKDRVDTTAQVWMGLTMGCAKCHTHKYDPITQHEYYSFYALFNQTEDADRGDDSPTAPMPTAAQRAEKQRIEARLKDWEEKFWQPIEGLKEKQIAWEKRLVANGSWRSLALVSGSGVGGTELKAGEQGVITAAGAHPETETNILKFAAPSGRITALRMEILVPEGRKGPGRHAPDRNVVISEFEVPGIKLKNGRADFSQEEWHARQAVDGDFDKGWAFSPQQDRAHVILFDLETPQEISSEVTIKIAQRFPKLQLERFRILVSTNDPAGLKPEVILISEWAAIPEAKRTAADRKRLEEGFRKEFEPTASADQEIGKARAELKQVEAAIPKTPVMRELAAEKQRKNRVHQRGNFLEPGDEVAPGIPAAFGKIPAGAATNRLGVAQWLADAKNPLTARVAVNRAWARLFGNGLVETEEDFGLQGSVPTHPELLDWLAADFASHGSWKQLLKTLVMSATYRQSSEVAAPKLQRDPRNLLLSRAPRVRLSAEVVRDQALAAAGLLSSKMHGPSVMPPQPEGIWRAVYSGLKWRTAQGDDRHRRALYTFLRRTSPYPSLTTFDAGSGEVCLVRRIRTNTPLQALVTLNDPAFFEAAGALGSRMRAEGLVAGFEATLARPPAKAERRRLEKLLASARAEFKLNPGAALELVQEANRENQDARELAAWISVANVILNLDETLMRP